MNRFKKLSTWILFALWLGLVFAGTYVSIKYIYGANPIALPPTAFFSGWVISGKVYTWGTMLLDVGSGNVITAYIPFNDSAWNPYITGVDLSDYYTGWEVDTLLLWYVALTDTGNRNVAYDWVMVNSGDALYFRDNSWSYILRDSVDTGFNFPTSDILVPSEKAVVEYLSIYNPNQLMVGATGADCTWALVGTLIFSGDIFYWCTATTWRVALHE
jgi:hypothetical protein